MSHPHATEDIRLTIAWAESAVKKVESLTSIPDLDAFIVDNNQRLGRLEQGAPGHWTVLRNVMHAQDGKLRAKVRQGVG